MELSHEQRTRNGVIALRLSTDTDGHSHLGPVERLQIHGVLRRACEELNALGEVIWHDRSIRGAGSSVTQEKE